jgi:hypothetical protein
MEVIPARIRESGRFVVCGRFGSGKTEVAVNFALRCVGAADHTSAESDPGSVVLIDLDIVTPYFRSREVAEAMCARGVRVVSPAAVSRHLDTPAIPPQIMGLLQEHEQPIVLDVGGDEQGARALGQYSAVLRQRGYTMYFVVNPYRPFTGDVDGIQEAVRLIERSSRLLVTGLVANPHMMAGTTPVLFFAGEQIVQNAGRRMGLPVAFTAVERSLAPRVIGTFPPERPVLTLERFFALPWAED